MDYKKLDNFFPRYSTNEITNEFFEKQVSTTKMLKINTTKLNKNFSTVLNQTSSSSSSYDFYYNKLIHYIIFNFYEASMKPDSILRLRVALKTRFLGVENFLDSLHSMNLCPKEMIFVQNSE